MTEDELTTIPIKKRTRNRLGSNGTKCESWDGIVNRLMDENVKLKEELHDLETVRSECLSLLDLTKEYHKEIVRLNNVLRERG